MTRPLVQLLVFAAALSPALTPAWADTSLEYAVKAAYLTKFVPFIDWPDASFASANAPVAICILGADPFGATIDKSVGAATGGRPLAIRRIPTADAATGCQIVYTSDAQALDALQGKPLVTVTDSDSPTHGIISFMTLDNHVRFDIDDAMAEKNGIRISSKLLELAHTVTRKSEGP
jgi:hypothetical protein